MMTTCMAASRTHMLRKDLWANIQKADLVYVSSCTPILREKLYILEIHYTSNEVGLSLYW